MVSKTKWIEPEESIQEYLRNLRYALDKNASIFLMKDRLSDKQKAERYTNRFTVGDLFPDMDPVVALKEELAKLQVWEYVETVRDIHRPWNSEMRVFAKEYKKEHVYIKIRVELLAEAGYGEHSIFVMSFHYAEKTVICPYKKKVNSKEHAL